MTNNLIVWDIETVPDVKDSAAANGHVGRADGEVRTAMGERYCPSLAKDSRKNTPDPMIRSCSSRFSCRERTRASFSRTFVE
jgi:hypothetical protein